MRGPIFGVFQNVRTALWSFIFSLADDMFALGGPYDLCFGYCHWALRMDSVHDWQNNSIAFCMFSLA